MTELLVDGPDDARWTLLLAHGAGAGSDSEFMVDMAARLGEAGLRVVRFDFPYMQRAKAAGRRRPPDRAPVLLSAYADAIQALAEQGVSRARLLIGGKSLGGRIASLIADEQGVGGLVCLGYPFHPPGKPDRLRTEHLLTLRTPALICQGERDTFGRPEEVAGYGLPDSLRVAWLPDGDHSLKPRKSSGYSESGNRAVAVQLIMDFVSALG